MWRLDMKWWQNACVLIFTRTALLLVCHHVMKLSLTESRCSELLNGWNPSALVIQLLKNTKQNWDLRIHVVQFEYISVLSECHQWNHSVMCGGLHSGHWCVLIQMTLPVSWFEIFEGYKVKYDLLSAWMLFLQENEDSVICDALSEVSVFISPQTSQSTSHIILAFPSFILNVFL